MMKFEPVDFAANLDDMKKAFLEAYSSTGTVREAADAVGVPTRTAYAWRKNDRAFMEEWDRITHEDILPVLEQVAIERAREKSDLMLMFLMKAYNRKLYDDNFPKEKEKDTTISVVYEELEAKRAPNQVPDTPGPDGPPKEP